MVDRCLPRRTPDRGSIVVPGRPAAIAVARHYVRRRLRHADLPTDRRDDIVLAASELVTDAVEDGPDRVGMSVDVAVDGAVRLVVTSALPDPRRPSERDGWRDPVLHGTGARTLRLDVAGERIVTCSFDGHGHRGRRRD